MPLQTARLILSEFPQLLIRDRINFIPKIDLQQSAFPISRDLLIKKLIEFMRYPGRNMDTISNTDNWKWVAGIFAPHFFCNIAMFHAYCITKIAHAQCKSCHVE